MMELKDIDTNCPVITKDIIKLFRGNKIVLTWELLKSRIVSYIGSVLISSEGYINESNNLTQEKLIISCFLKCYHLYNRN